MKRLINKVLEWIGYHFVGYKVDIKHLEKTINKLKDKNLLKDDEPNMFNYVSNEDVFVKRCAELQTELDEAKEDNKQLNKALDEERSKEAYINTELKQENKAQAERIDNLNYMYEALERSRDKWKKNYINLSDERGENA